MDDEHGFQRTQRLTLSDGDVHVAEAGEGSPILFLHGNPDTHHVWASVVSLLARTHRCIAPDLPGYGKTANPKEVTLDAQGEFVRELLDALQIDRVHLAVHDVGGNYGLVFATTHPQRVRALTIFNTNFFPEYRWHFMGRVWRTPLVGELAMALTFESTFVQLTKLGAPHLPVEEARAAFRRYEPRTREHVLRYYRYMDSERYQGWDTKMREATKDIPRQVLWGESDPYLPKENADKFGVPSEHVHRFPELSHWVMAEGPQRAAELIGALATSTSADRRPADS